MVLARRPRFTGRGRGVGSARRPFRGVVNTQETNPVLPASLDQYGVLLQNASRFIAGIDLLPRVRASDRSARSDSTGSRSGSGASTRSGTAGFVEIAGS